MEKFYYLRDSFGHPRVTVCLLVSSDNSRIARGISLCSYEDFIVKKEGRNKARGRATQAFLLNKNSKPIKESLDARDILKEVLITENIPNLLDCFRFLSEIQPTLIDFELKLLERPIHPFYQLNLNFKNEK